MNCPHCRTPLVNDGSLSGQVVLCPSCGQQFAMPVVVVVRPAARPPRRSRRSPVKQLMMLATAIWLIVASVRLAWMISQMPLMEIPPLSPLGGWLLLGSLIVVSIPYALAMAVLTVVYFASR